MFSNEHIARIAYAARSAYTKANGVTAPDWKALDDEERQLYLDLASKQREPLPTKSAIEKTSREVFSSAADAVTKIVKELTGGEAKPKPAKHEA